MTLILRSALGALAALCALQSGPLQAQTIHEYAGQQVSAPWTPAAGPATRGAAGRFDADASPDAVVLTGVTPVVLVDADVRDARVALPLEANDLDALSGASPDGLDVIVSVGPTGLLATRYDVQNAGFVSEVLATGGWLDARLVRAIDVDGDGLVDLVGVADDGVTLLLHIAQGAPLAFSQATGGVASAPVRHLVGAQWDADAALELALLTDAGVEVLEADGTLRDAWSGVLPGGALARLTQAGQSTDRLVWITAYAPPAVQMLRVLVPGGAVEESLDLGGLDAFAAIGGDVDLDGDDDVLVSHHFSNELIWFENERSPAAPQATSFATPNPRLTLLAVGPDGSALQNQATPICSDLDGDGDLDVLFPAATSGTLELLRGELVDETKHAPSVDGGTWDPATSRLELALSAPLAGTGASTHLRARVWRKATPTALFECAPVADLTLDLAAGWIETLSLTLPETEAEFDRVYSIELSLVVVDGAGAEKITAPASIHYLVGSESSKIAVEGLPGLLGSKVVETSGTEASETSDVRVMRKDRTGKFGSGFVPYI